MQYFSFGEDSGGAGVRLDRLESHLRFLREGGYRLMFLREMVEGLYNVREDLPSRVVSIVLSGSSGTISSRGWKLFEQYNVPVTIFIPTDDIGGSGRLSWSDLRSMKSSGLLEFGSQGRVLTNLIKVPIERVKADLGSSSEKIRDELGVERVDMFAYPYGLSSRALQRIVYDGGVVLGLGQHSGAFIATHNRFFLPAFGVTKSFSDQERLELVLSTLSLSLSGNSWDSVVRMGVNPPNFMVSVLEGSGFDDLDVSCFHSRQGRLDVEELVGEEGFRPIFVSPLPKGRSRLNCTASVFGRGTVWLGFQFYVSG